MPKRIVRVSKLGMSNIASFNSTPKVWYQLPVTRGMLYVREAIHQLTFDPSQDGNLIRVETDNIIYVQVK